ncbi:VOC family protein [Lacibacterium aquatile]|uniref:VOC family protein n=1 Tax=Lacibacterium aquatile TaxID=1168082 RepID=A0ABW5DVF8_9PROT
MRMIFVNLPVKGLDASKRFFSALGFTFNSQFSDETATCMIIEKNIFAMLLTEAKFKDYIIQPISDAHRATEILTCLSVQSRVEADSLLEKALVAGAKPWNPVLDYGSM